MKFKRAIIAVLTLALSIALFACRKAAPDSDDSDVDTSVEYTVTFSVGTEAANAGVTVSTDSVKVFKNDVIGDDNMPTIRGTYAEHTFGGWFTAPDGGGTQVTSSTKITSDLSLTAKWVSNTELDQERAEYEASLTEANGWMPNHLYIHYKRSNHKSSEEGTTNGGAPNYNDPIVSEEYSDWVAWIWPAENANGRLFNACKIDASGVVYDIDLTKTYTDCGWDGNANNKQGASANLTINYDSYKDTAFGFLIHKKSSRGIVGKHWISDGGDAFVNIATAKRDNGTTHWFVSENAVPYGAARFDKVVTVDDPYADIEPGSAVTAKTGPTVINSLADNSSKYPTVGVQGYDDVGVGYQIFISSFADGNFDGKGDLRGIINKLPYLDEELNVDILWLTPFQQSTSYHGYDITDYFSVDPKFGTLADYRELVYKAHSRGMKVVMDYVLNHTSKSNPWFVKSSSLVVENEGEANEIDYRQFYSWINEEQFNALPASQQVQWFGDAHGYYYFSSFDSSMPELNYDYQPVRDAIIEVCNYWMSFGLDGFRLDAVKHIYMHNETSGKTEGPKIVFENNKSKDPNSPKYDKYAYDITRNQHFFREFNYRLKSLYPNAFIVSENFDGNPANVAPFYAGMDSQFNFNNYYDTTRALMYKNAGKYSHGNLVGNITGNIARYSAVNSGYIDGMFTSNHDLPRARDRLNISSNDSGTNDTYYSFYTGSTVNTAMVSKTDDLLRLYYAFNMTMPGISWIYYGDEIGMTGVMDFTIRTGSTSTTDSDAHEDRIYRQPMKWEETGNASYDIGHLTLRCELVGLNTTEYVRSVAYQKTQAGSLLKWTQTLTSLRDTHPELVRGKLSGFTDDNGKISYTLTKGASKTKVYINMSGSAWTISGTPYSTTYGTAAYHLSGSSLANRGVAIVQG